MGVKFDRMKDGYNRYQVDALIEELNMHISSLERSNEAYRNRCAQLEEQVSAMGKGGDSPVEHLREKEDAASQMVAIAMKEANTIVATAKQNADVIVSEALLNARLMLADIVKLADETEDAKGTMRRQTERISRLLDEFERNDNINIVRNRGGITAENLSVILKRNDIKKSEAYQSGFLEGTVPMYDAYMALKNSLIRSHKEDE